jgi:transposase
MRHEFADHEWAAIKPMLPDKPRGVPRGNDHCVLNGIFWVLRCGAPWRDLRVTACTEHTIERFGVLLQRLGKGAST